MVQLDAEYLVEFNRVNGAGKRTSLAIPYAFDETDEQADFRDLRNERIREGLESEYLRKLSELLRKVPKRTQADNEGNDQLHCLQLTDQQITHDLHLMPELAAIYDKQPHITVKTEEPADQNQNQVGKSSRTT